MADELKTSQTKEVKETKKSDKPSIWKQIANFFKSYRGELKKITWPTPKQTAKNTAIVLAAMVIVGAFVCLLDLAFAKLIELLSQIGN